mmetsp:Transcript_27301/g.57360  ORF Transcript_27301/g.57360 Transcript_27301/m.57360 type:complete len:184 (-) Transcript_27301:220-771(-)
MHRFVKPMSRSWMAHFWCLSENFSAGLPSAACPTEAFGALAVGRTNGAALSPPGGCLPRRRLRGLAPSTASGAGIGSTKLGRWVSVDLFLLPAQSSSFAAAWHWSALQRSAGTDRSELKLKRGDTGEARRLKLSRGDSGDASRAGPKLRRGKAGALGATSTSSCAGGAIAGMFRGGVTTAASA